MLGQVLKVGLSVWNSQSRAQNADDVLAVERALRDLFGRMDPGLSGAEPAFFNGAQHPGLRHRPAAGGKRGADAPRQGAVADG